MENRTGIFVGVACHKPHAEFMLSLSEFLQNSSLKYDIETLLVYGKSLMDAENIIAKRFLQTDYPFLLMLEDDHWGHTVEMLDALVESPYAMCGIKYYSRHFPYVVLPMRAHPTDKNKGAMETIGPMSGYWPGYIVGFGMTIIKREAFSLLEEPYFQLNELEATHKLRHATDQNLCDRLMMAGASVGGFYDYCLVHRGLEPEMITEYRDKNLSQSMLFNLSARNQRRRLGVKLDV